jgi:hypothetical protein
MFSAEHLEARPIESPDRVATQGQGCYKDSRTHSSGGPMPFPAFSKTLFLKILKSLAASALV